MIPHHAAHSDTDPAPVAVLGSLTDDDSLLACDLASSGPISSVCPSSQPMVFEPSQAEDVEPQAAGTSGPSLESIRFQVSDDPLTPLGSPSSRRHVTLSRGSLDPLPMHFFEGVSTPVKDKVAEFVTYVRRPLSQPIVASPPPRRRTRAAAELPTPIRRSERLARKSHHRATKPALQAQNVMMKKLGLTSASCPPDATSF